jgi:enoyl-[acyl-carrier protein] reductase I
MSDIMETWSRLQAEARDKLPPVLTGRKALVIGVANEHSIAWGCAQAMHRAGAEIAMTYLNEKARTFVEPLAQAVDARLFMPLEVRDPAQVDALFDRLSAEWGRLDILVHSIAFAPRNALEGRVTDCPCDGFLTAMDVSCWSFLDLARRSEKLMTEGGTMLTMSYNGANEVIENYGIMGPVKAALESAVRYMASELGPKVFACTPSVLARWRLALHRAFATSMSSWSAWRPRPRCAAWSRSRKSEWRAFS